MLYRESQVGVAWTDTQMVRFRCVYISFKPTCIRSSTCYLPILIWHLVEWTIYRMNNESWELPEISAPSMPQLWQLHLIDTLTWGSNSYASCGIYVYNPISITCEAIIMSKWQAPMNSQEILQSIPPLTQECKFGKPANVINTIDGPTE